MELKIKDRYQTLVPSLSEKEYEQLKASIRDHGLQIPIVVNQKGEILDGHNRHRACLELDIPPVVVFKSFDTAEEEEIFVLESNIIRRQLTDIQRIEIVHDLLEPLQSELARKRQLASLNVGNRGPLAPLVSNENNENEESGRVNDIMAEKAGVSATTYHRATTVLDEAPNEIKEKVKAGDMSISEAYAKVKPQKSKKERPAKDVLFLPQNLFNAAIEAIESAREKGEKHLAFQHDGHNLKVGSMEVSTG